MKKLFPALLCVFLAIALTSCEDDDNVYVETILGYWKCADMKITVETSNAEITPLLTNVYIDREKENENQILFFGEKSVFNRYQNIDDEDPIITIYTLNEGRIALGGVQGLSNIKVLKDTMFLSYDEVNFLTEEKFQEDLAEVGYTGEEKIKLSMKMYNWSFVRIEDPFPDETNE